MTCPEHLLPAFIVLSSVPGRNAYYAVIENSFSMGRSADRALICWSHKGTSSPLLNALVGDKVVLKIDGRRQADEVAERLDEKDETLTIFDITDPALPIEIDWDSWNRDNEPADTLSGVRNKFTARNAPFRLK